MVKLRMAVEPLMEIVTALAPGLTDAPDVPANAGVADEIAAAMAVKPLSRRE
jgi:hypothetical protein